MEKNVPGVGTCAGTERGTYIPRFGTLLGTNVPLVIGAAGTYLGRKRKTLRTLAHALDSRARGGRTHTRLAKWGRGMGACGHVGGTWLRLCVCCVDGAMREV